MIIHTAILGSVERYIYAVFDSIAKAEKRGEVPKLPTWLSPVQARIIPITRQNVDFALKLAEYLEGRFIRVDVDDREETLSKRVRDAEREWIPYVVVVGAREEETRVLNVRIRGLGQMKMSPEDLAKLIEEETRGYPKKRLNMPKLLSQRPSYKQL